MPILLLILLLIFIVIHFIKKKVKNTIAKRNEEYNRLSDHEKVMRMFDTQIELTKLEALFRILFDGGRGW